jgi:hypothetical protein
VIPIIAAVTLLHRLPEGSGHTLDELSPSEDEVSPSQEE